ncbi:MAG: FtsQ-type POTRA domain-containing protein [candidate division Zixibacteria bacterium]|nr:FtsQ-type POTRA domain-containing protein [candidate division Zixibacteria bacterium]
MLIIRNLSIAFLLTLTLIGTFIFLTNFPGFGIKTIQIEGNQKVSDLDILNLCPVKLGQNFFKVDTDEISKKILSEPRIETVNIERLFPQRILIRLSEKKPIYLINLGNMYGLTQRGEIIPLEENLDLPVVNVVSLKKVTLYHKIKDRKIDFALSLHNSLAKIDANILNLISEVNLKEKDNVILYLVPRGAKVFLGCGEFEKKLIRLSLILREEKEFEKIEYVDLRFKGQAIVRRFE